MMDSRTVVDDVAENIMNERRGEVDRNPRLPCHECGETFPWRGYWKPRVEGRIENPHTDEWLCDSCHHARVKLERRETANRALTEWCE